MKKEYYLVTGVAGFIGSHTTLSLLEKGYNVVGIDDFNDYYNPEIKEQNAELLNREGFVLIRGDIRDKNIIKNIFENYHITRVIHLAARAGVRRSLIEPQLYFDVNVNGTINLLEESKNNNVINFIFASSSSVYGENKKIPFNESDVTDLQVSPYAASKKSAELVCRTYSHMYNLNVTCLRFFTVYGPSGRPDMAPYKFTDLIYKSKPIEMYGDGSSERDYTYISDIVNGVIQASLTSQKYEIINLGDSSPIKLIDFINVIEKHLGKKAIIIKKPMPKGDVIKTYADISKAKALLNYNPQIKIVEGMKKFIDWYLLKPR